MMGWPTNDAPGSFWTTPVADAAARLSDLMRHYRPDVVVTYDENGFYGHPDHIQAHRVTMAAVAESGIQAKVYWTTAPRSGMEEMFRVFREFAPEVADSAEEGSDTELPDDFGLPDDEISTWVDTAPFARQKYEALAAHSSQEENIFFLRMGLERFSQFMSTETFVRVQDHTNSPLPEDDLFAGLR
jgi:LmbE family N-acetylglucosaminyl deacetylase